MYICRRVCLHLCNSRLLCTYKRDVHDCHLRIFFLWIFIAPPPPPTPPPPLNITINGAGVRFRFRNAGGSHKIGEPSGTIYEKKNNNNNKYKHHLKSQTTIIAFHMCGGSLNGVCARWRRLSVYTHYCILCTPSPHTHTYTLTQRKRRRHTGSLVCNVIQ